MARRNAVRGRSIAGRAGDPQVEVNGAAHLPVRHEASDSGTWRIGTIYVCELRASAARLPLFAIKKPRMNRSVKRVSPGSG